jgi:hypothetical protein
MNVFGEVRRKKALTKEQIRDHRKRPYTRREQSPSSTIIEEKKWKRTLKWGVGSSWLVVSGQWSVVSQLVSWWWVEDEEEKGLKRWKRKKKRRSW